MIQPKLAALVAACATVLLAGCVATGPFPGVPILSGHEAPPAYKGTKAAPQVIYRIDEHRYFEVVPETDAACDAPVYFVDKANGIRSYVMEAKSRGGNHLVIDAANTQYLVAPMIRGSGSCYTCGGSWLPYSVDGGRTWKNGKAASSSDPLILSGSRAYVTFRAGGVRMVSSVDLARGQPALTDWRYEPDGLTPRPLKPAVDSKFHCVPNGKE